MIVLGVPKNDIICGKKYNSENEEFKYDINKLIINEKNKSFKLVKNNSHPNFYLIDLIQYSYPLPRPLIIISLF